MVVTILYVLYMVVFSLYHDEVGIGITAFSAIPVLAASWYFGIYGGAILAILTVFSNVIILAVEGHSHLLLLEDPGQIIGSISLVVFGIVVGQLGMIARQRRDALAKLEEYERERQDHTHFLEQLNEITAMALEADSLAATLDILVARIGKLFKANDSFFSLWDETRRMPIPTAASGSMSDIYPFIQFEPGEQTLTASVIEARHPIAIVNIENSPNISPRVASFFPCRSMLGLPLIVQDRNLGALLLGYKKTRSFTEHDLLHAELTAEQVAQVLSKSLLLEEERKQVKQLTALHDVALISIAVDNEDELIRRVTDVIGQNMFTDNFGVLLLDEPAGMLRTHPSYHFSSDKRRMTGIPLGAGVTGHVAITGKAQRIGNVRRMKEYLDLDDRTISELCVPIKFKERILGVINVESTKREAFTEHDERLLITLAGQVATAMEQIHRAQAERKWLDQLAHSNELIYALAQITTHIEKAFSIDDIIRNLGAELREIDMVCIMAAYNRERALLTVNYTSLEPQHIDILEEALGSPLIDHSFSPDKLSSGNLLQPAVLANPLDEIQTLFAHMPTQDVWNMLEEIGVGTGMEPLRLPLTFEDNLLGILWVWGKGLTRADLPIMSIFARQIGVSLERARLFEEVQSLALTDPLTNLQNRRSLFELGRVEFARAERMNQPFCCMMLDLDHFKHINDTYGHMVGDHVLKEFAHRCKCSVREVDLVGRYGGEELIILLPETDRNLAIEIAERLRASISAMPIHVDAQEVSVTVSIGVAAKDENTLDLETLIARADQAMYIAKHRGRNRVAISR
jgi:diguanylate cyclase (GGDEF)-like protein